MEKIYSESELRAAILQLEIRQTEEEEMLKEAFHLTFESIKPINIIKNTIRDVITSPEIKENISGALIGLTAGYLSQIVSEKVTKSPFKKLVGTVVFYSIRRVVANNPETIKLFSQYIFHQIFHKKKMNSEKSDK